jgi:hypothetical protein
MSIRTKLGQFSGDDEKTMVQVLEIVGADGRNRTADLLITNEEAYDRFQPSLFVTDGSCL